MSVIVGALSNNPKQVSKSVVGDNFDKFGGFDPCDARRSGGMSDSYSDLREPSSSIIALSQIALAPTNPDKSSRPRIDTAISIHSTKTASSEIFAESASLPAAPQAAVPVNPSTPTASLSDSVWVPPSAH